MNNDSKRRSRDSSLYKDVAARKEATGKEQDPAVNSRIRFVLESTDPEVVPVEHRAVIEELHANLTAIQQDREHLENDLQNNNKANKLQIAQIKGRLADLNRKQAEIEKLLSAKTAAASGDEGPTDG